MQRIDEHEQQREHEHEQFGGLLDYLHDAATSDADRLLAFITPARFHDAADDLGDLEPLANAKHGPRKETALHAAARVVENSHERTMMLLAMGASSAALCVHRGTPLHQAARFANVAAVKAMLLYQNSAARAALVNVQDKNGWTCLHAAVYKPPRGAPQSRVEIVAALMNAGVRADLRNFAGQTAHDLAVVAGCHDAADAIVREAAFARPMPTPRPESTSADTSGEDTSSEVSSTD